MRYINTASADEAQAGWHANVRFEIKENRTRHGRYFICLRGRLPYLNPAYPTSTLLTLPQPWLPYLNPGHPTSTLVTLTLVILTLVSLLGRLNTDQPTLPYPYPHPTVGVTPEALSDVSSMEVVCAVTEDGES